MIGGGGAELSAPTTDESGVDDLAAILDRETAVDPEGRNVFVSALDTVEVDIESIDDSVVNRVMTTGVPVITEVSEGEYAVILPRSKYLVTEDIDGSVQIKYQILAADSNYLHRSDIEAQLESCTEESRDYYLHLLELTDGTTDKSNSEILSPIALHINGVVGNRVYCVSVDDYMKSKLSATNGILTVYKTGANVLPLNNQAQDVVEGFSSICIQEGSIFSKPDGLYKIDITNNEVRSIESVNRFVITGTLTQLSDENILMSVGVTQLHINLTESSRFDTDHSYRVLLFLDGDKLSGEVLSEVAS